MATLSKVDITKTITKNGITLSANSGNGNAAITVTATANPKQTIRMATFTIVAGVDVFVKVRVIQAGTTTTNVENDTKIDL